MIELKFNAPQTVEFVSKNKTPRLAYLLSQLEVF